jgi:transposase
MTQYDDARDKLEKKYGLDPRHIIDLRQQGLSDEDIAMDFGVSLKTIESLKQDIRNESWKERSQRIKGRLGLI